MLPAACLLEAWPFDDSTTWGRRQALRCVGIIKRFGKIAKARRHSRRCSIVAVVRVYRGGGGVDDVCLSGGGC